MKKFVILIMSLFLITFFVSGCDAISANSSSPPESEKADNILSQSEPIIGAALPSPTIVMPPEPPNVNPMPDQGNQEGASPGYFPEDWQIATPLYPNFNIVSAKLLSCDGQWDEEPWYLVIGVKNNGPYYFQWISLNVQHGGFGQAHQYWEMPWRPDGSSCSLPENGQATLAPGDSAFIYFPITPVYPESEYDITLWMCTYTSIPDPCPMRQYTLNENIWALNRIPTLEIEEIALCWVGPGPYYEVVNSIPGGTEVELLGIGDVEGFLVVQEPKYQRACWVQAEFAGEVPEEVLRSLTTFDTPILAAGVVSGRVYKDQDANGAFGGSDVGFPGARVSLAPGTCSNYGQPITTTTDSSGWYSFSNVDPGSYCVFTAKPNTCKKFSTANGYELAVDWASVLEKNFGLEGCR